MNRINLIRDQSGWSLVEIMVVLTLMVIILLGIYMVFDAGLFIYNTSSYSSTANQNVREPINRMLREIKESSVNTITTGNSFTFPQTPQPFSAQNYIVFASARTTMSASPPAVFMTDNITNTCKPLWLKYVFYYIDSASPYRFCRYEVPLVADRRTTENNKKFGDFTWPTHFIPGEANTAYLIMDREATCNFLPNFNTATNTAIISMNVYYTTMKRYGGTEREQMQIVESIKLMN